MQLCDAHTSEKKQNIMQLCNAQDLADAKDSGIAKL
jgi:hypothetical protein